MENERPPSMQRGRSQIENDVVEHIRVKMQRTRCIRKIAMVLASGTLVVVGVGMAVLMLIAAVTGKNPPADGTKDWAKAPDLAVVIPLLLGMAITSVMLGVLLQFQWFARSILGTLEYTTIVIMDLKQGRTYKYKHQPTSPKGATPDELFAREVHQLKVEAGLAGWSAEAVNEQLRALRAAHAMKYEQSDERSKRELIKLEAAKVGRMLMHTVYAMPLPARVINALLALVVVVFGALGAFLGVGIAHMPDPNDDALWTEISWQVINAIFSVIAIWKGPQRARLLWHLARRDYEALVDGVTRSLMGSGVLLKRSEMLVVGVLRGVNVVAQYFCSFFMWGYLSRCYQEATFYHTGCKSKPAWGVPVFLVLGFASDQASNAVLHRCIVRCPYMLWPAIDTPKERVARTRLLEREEEEEGDGAPATE